MIARSCSAGTLLRKPAAIEKGLEGKDHDSAIYRIVGDRFAGISEEESNMLTRRISCVAPRW